MEQYIGTKIVKAKPMIFGYYSSYRGWLITDNEDPAREGYLVEYEDGYQSWSPKEVFEAAYRQLTIGKNGDVTIAGINKE